MHDSTLPLNDEVELQDLPLFKLQKLEVATNFFSIENKIGQGGFGPVYKVTILSGVISYKYVKVIDIKT